MTATKRPLYREIASLLQEQRVAMHARRAMALLNADMGVTTAYALAAIALELVDSDDLRGHKVHGHKRWFLA